MGMGGSLSVGVKKKACQFSHFIVNIKHLVGWKLPLKESRNSITSWLVISDDAWAAFSSVGSASVFC